MRVLWWELFQKIETMCVLCVKQLFIYPVMILKFIKFWYLSEKNFISVSPGLIFLTGHMTGQPFNSVNLLVKSRSSQCFQYLTLLTASCILSLKWDRHIHSSWHATTSWGIFGSSTRIYFWHPHPLTPPTLPRGRRGDPRHSHPNSYLKWAF